MKMVFKTVASDGSLEFVLSDETVDRYGDIIEAAGWVLTNFRKNPIALFVHGGSFPIGTWTNIRVEGKALKARLKLAARGTSARIDELIGLVEQGILRAVSVGFRPIEWDPIDEKRPYGPRRYKKQELLECSLVSVPANPSALLVAKSLQISDETLSLAFGEHAETRHGDTTASGEHAVNRTADQERSLRGLPPLPKGKSMKTISQRVADAKAALAVKQAKLNDLTAADDLDVDSIEGLNTEIATEQRELKALEAAEKTIAGKAAQDSGVPGPAINRRPLGFPQSDVKGVDLIVRRALVHSVSLYSGKSLDQVLDERYPGHEATALIAKTAAPLGTTTDAGFAAELMRPTWASFLDALRGKSVYPVMRDRGIQVSFDQGGAAYLPQLTAGGANGSFFAEGSPIRVGRVTTAAPQFNSRKMGIIIPFTREAARRSTPALEGVIRRAIVDDTAVVLDTTMLDATAGDTIRPAGLLNGVSAVATGYGGGDHIAVKEDFKALLQPFIDAKAASSITVAMNPQQGLSIALMDGPDNNSDWFKKLSERVAIVESENVTPGRLIAVHNPSFATGLGDMPEFEVSNQATIHMEDTTPAPITTGGGPTVATPVRSFFQTDSQGIRMIMDVSWKMARTGMVQWIDGTSY